MFRSHLLLTSLLLGLGLLATALFTAAPSHADDAAYYLVVQHDTASTTTTQTQLDSNGHTSISTLQLSGSTSEVSCSRYASSAEAEAAAADRYAGQSVQVVLAVDAMHALAQVAGIADDLLALLPQLADSDLCTP